MTALSLLREVMYDHFWPVRRFLLLRRLRRLCVLPPRRRSSDSEQRDWYRHVA